MDKEIEIPLDGKYLSDDEIKFLKWLVNRRQEGKRITLSDWVIVEGIKRKQRDAIIKEGLSFESKSA